MLSKTVFYDWHGLNDYIFHFFNKLFLEHHVFSELLVLISHTCTVHSLPYVLFFLMFVAVAGAYVKGLQHNKALYQEYVVTWTKIFATITIALAAASILIPICKKTFDYTRPLCTFAYGHIRILPEFGMDSLSHMIAKRCNNDGSFPSGHATIAFILSVGLMPAATKLMKVLLVIFFITICISRLVIGVHYPADLVGGALLGASVYFPIRALVNYVRAKLWHS